MTECPECHAPAGEEGFEIVEITTTEDRQEWGITRWKLRCFQCGYHHAFIAKEKKESPQEGGWIALVVSIVSLLVAVFVWGRVGR